MNLSSLHSVADLITLAGGKPNARYRRALKALDGINTKSSSFVLIGILVDEGYGDFSV